MGSGAAGYRLTPDWKVYAVLQVWEDLSSAQGYFDSHPLAKSYAERSVYDWHLYMHALRAKGTWGGENPFEGDNPDIAATGYLGVLTRATIRRRYLRRFWNYVPQSQRPLNRAQGLLFHKGIGEVPLLQMATFSLWDGEAAMKAFAYGSAAHQTAIAKTRQLDWYQEELFARFSPFKSEGSWPGVPPLDGLSHQDLP
ncbi:DUF3291 domain-containing protein [Robiginitalea sp. SC105]|uniref:DUF3291 domain-containing protein n=1 Tax=Robiginitalea sp. SC105 TaxID=2762332 RepID=UPI00163AE51D|nr:DUF3291 domain-containing protein [Robiginitalea sp. SC105]MBC2840032.1 DUF3291 domain-containing protein [Robiginitalea sp. SC105]